MKGQKTYSKAMDLAIEQASIVLAQCGKLGGELDELPGCSTTGTGITLMFRKCTSC